MSERVKQAVEESLSDLNASQQEQMNRSAEQLASSFVFIDYDLPVNQLKEFAANSARKLPLKNSTLI
jgi:hypothetical protein